MQTEDFCPGTLCFSAVRQKWDAFKEAEGDVEVVGFVSCGGCPGKKAVFRARELVRRGADTIAFSSCIRKGSPNGFPCPFAAQMKEVMQKDLGEKVKILDYTH
jgi:predicted metal-binding protein